MPKVIPAAATIIIARINFLLWNLNDLFDLSTSSGKVTLKTTAKITINGYRTPFHFCQVIFLHLRTWTRSYVSSSLK
jgi:hypothetical protein